MDDEMKAYFGFLARFRHPTTLADYEMDLKQFQAWTRQMNILSMLAVERVHLDPYVAHMVTRGLAPATINRRFGTVRGFFRYAHVEGMILKDPAAYIATPKIQHDQQRRTYYESV